MHGNNENTGFYNTNAQIYGNYFKTIGSAAVLVGGCFNATVYNNIAVDCIGGGY